MNLNSALASALTGLTASARAAGVVSTNLANVLTEGYGVRDIELASRTTGSGGVSVLGTTRQVDPGLLSERRAADSALSYQTTLATSAATLEREIGAPDDPSSLTARVAALEASLVSAATKPEEDARLAEVVARAGEVTEKLNSISDRIQQERTSADAQIGQAVTRINTLLDQVQSLNAQIANARNAGNPSASFEDQRQQVVDELSEYVPVRLAERNNGTIALYTTGGAPLVDGSAAEFTFTTSNLVAPHMTLSNGLLSGLEINGVSINLSSENNPISGGRLAALFEARDGALVDAQTQVDAVARDLIERFQQPALDATRGLGDPGLFTDGGAAFTLANEVGVAGRLSLNSLIDPVAGGDVWRLRDGLGATLPGPVGDSSLLQAYSDTLSGVGSLASGNLGATSRSFSGHAAALTSKVSQDRLNLEQNLSFAASRQAGLVEIELSQGVDSDEQLQRLLLIEQAYSANARVIQTVDELLETLLRI